MNHHDLLSAARNVEDLAVLSGSERTSLARLLREAAQRLATQPHSPDAADTGRVADADSIALEAAREISLMWGRDRSQFVAKIQVRVIAAITAALAAQHQQ